MKRCSHAQAYLGARHQPVLAAPPGVQHPLVTATPTTYSRAPYVGGRGWVGMYLDAGPIDWDLVELHLTDAHAFMAAGR